MNLLPLPSFEKSAFRLQHEGNTIEILYNNAPIPNLVLGRIDSIQLLLLLNWGSNSQQDLDNIYNWGFVSLIKRSVYLEPRYILAAMSSFEVEVSASMEGIDNAPLYCLSTLSLRSKGKIATFHYYFMKILRTHPKYRTPSLQFVRTLIQDDYNADLLLLMFLILDDIRTLEYLNASLSEATNLKSNVMIKLFKSLFPLVNRVVPYSSVAEKLEYEI